MRDRQILLWTWHLIGYTQVWTKNKIILLICVGTTVLLLIGFNIDFVGDTHQPHAQKILLYWTPYLDKLEYVVDCNGVSCVVTDDRRFLKTAQAVFFYGSNINLTDLPLPRTAPWALFHEESPKNVPFLSFHRSISTFNYTATFSRHSDIPLTLQYLPEVSDITDLRFVRTLEDQNYLQTVDKLAPILYLQSICDTLSERDLYVAELQKHIRVDSYGKCLNNQPKNTISGYLSEDNADALKFISRYKFVIAYENAVCNDYVSEKFWRAIRLGVVPIYFGAPNIRDWLPNPRSAILIENFATPQGLANYVKQVNRNDSLYLQYLEHKHARQPISNQFLLDKIYRGRFLSRQQQRDLECMVCTGRRPRQRPKEEFQCFMKYPPGIKPKKYHPLKEMYLQGRCEARTFLKLVGNNQPYTKKEFDTELHDVMLSDKGC